MSISIKQKAQVYLSARHSHPAWQILAARKAPLVLSCLQNLFKEATDGIEFDTALQALSDLLADYANDGELGINNDDYASQARKELREWISRRLIIERNNRIYATDALQTAMAFVNNLQQRLMTSTASRLSVVQREIDHLDIQLNPDPKRRASQIKQKIAELQHELEQTEKGNFVPLSEQEAIEGIREVFSLASGLRADFRRVEDSYREADKALRESIIHAQHHRGEIVDELLERHQKLLETPEGTVFNSFHQQLLSNGLELEKSKQSLRNIIRHPLIDEALNHTQKRDLRYLFILLSKESEGVFRAREHSERDVRGFLQAGLATEHHRVGQLLDQLLSSALDIDWTSRNTRQTPSDLAPIAPNTNNVPLIERLRFKELNNNEPNELELSQQHTDLNDIDDDFWLSFDTLDHQALTEQTQALLQQQATDLSIAEIAHTLPPAANHDLETIALWISLARQTNAPVNSAETETIEVDHQDHIVRFNIPKTQLNAEQLAKLDDE